MANLCVTGSEGSCKLIRSEPTCDHGEGRETACFRIFKTLPRNILRIHDECPFRFAWWQVKPLAGHSLFLPLLVMCRTSPSDYSLPTREEIRQTRSNIATLELELSRLNTTLTNNQTQHRTIASQLSALQSSLSLLESENARLQSKIKTITGQVFRKKSYISPQRRLPKEMLGEIFVAHVRLDWKAPLIDASVCKRWRSVALSTPRLWSFLRFPSSPFDHPRLITLWLQRASNAPLHIHIAHEDVSEDVLERIKAVYCMKFKPWPTLLHKTSFSKLERLILDHDDASIDHLPRGVFTSLSNLRILHLHWFRFSRRPLLQWAWDLPPLEELHIASASWVWIDAVELVAPTLKRLAIDMGDVPAPPPPSVPVRPLDLPNLIYFAYGAQSQTLMMNDATRVPILSKVIQAPNLETFEDHTVIPLETSLPPEKNWVFPQLKEYVGRTSRELGEVKTLYPHVRNVKFVLDAETGVLDVASLVDSATEGALGNLEVVEMDLAEDLKGQLLVRASLRRFEEVRGRQLKMVYHKGREETPYQKVGEPFTVRETLMRPCPSATLGFLVVQYTHPPQPQHHVPEIGLVYGFSPIFIHVTNIIRFQIAFMSMYHHIAAELAIAESYTFPSQFRPACSS